jgi:hypothetical protein
MCDMLCVIRVEGSSRLSLEIKAGCRRGSQQRARSGSELKCAISARYRKFC